MHKIGFININNYRLCRNVSLPLEGFTPLVGQNNTGKSSILEALAWVLKPYALQVSDFAEAGRPVEVSARIDGITADVLDQIPDGRHRAAIEPFCRNGSIWIRAHTAGTTARAITQEIYDHSQYAGEGIPESWRAFPTGLPQAVGALLPEPLQINAMDDIGEDLGKAKAGSTIKALLDEIMEPILQAHAELTEALSAIRRVLTTGGDARSQHLSDFDRDASNALAHFFPGLNLELDLQVIEAKEFFKAGDLLVTDSSTGDRRRFDQLGTGAQRAIQMALIRHLADLRTTAQAGVARRLLLIDEPELYLHPQAVRRLRQALETLSRTGFQVVYSTHSPLMLSRENAADTIIVGKQREVGTFTRLPLRQAVPSALQEAEAQSRTLFELGNLSEIYFSERVVLCEGKTDRRLLPLAYETLYGRHPELDQITFVSVGSCSDIPKALPVLAAMGIRACAVADLDFAFTDARKGQRSLLPKEDEQLTTAKSILQRLQAEHGFPLGGNGLPTKDKNTGWQAADTWACFAKDAEGAEVVRLVQQTLKEQGIWVWAAGCIEHVTGHLDKGEDAIQVQELAIGQLTPDHVDEQMPEFRECFEWMQAR
ncbi:TPA: AAA family ATPase [Pseudomonas aeruginosa]|uniref:ATP-dependent nuclease n=1 Tax=Pseudomonas aeruginosa TaxID=287 RepID=UPI001CBD9EBA|nr:AAA family ATPase [Pseudomonas aeruginosa]HBO2993407.1 AAA family ATPase [Pseudomonas aeruginosa]HBO5656559.1 AAA family ATPase [Pseudomonas aeruginosa]HCI1863522.1 AAA family ATPase [Pseudomonas aeruginosa]HCI2647548.1 AAA family ATPase [Pseudomonas aeruginosa]